MANQDERAYTHPGEMGINESQVPEAPPEEVVIGLICRARKATGSIDALNFSRAACNVADALHTLTQVKMAG